MKAASWTLRRSLPLRGQPWLALAKAWDLSPLAARAAWMRDVDKAEDLAWRLDPSWSRTQDPYLLRDMGRAVSRIRTAVEKGEGICIYGDYDVDGVTAVAILVRSLEKLGAHADFFIPNRFDDGYGLNLECIRELAAQGKYRLIISVDCGIRSAREVAAGRELGLDWIITDHHAPGGTLPEACAILHPSLGETPNPHLSGAGVAFKLAQALLDAVPLPSGADAAFLDGLLKLVALGTVADMVPLVGENALLVKRGLQAMEGANGPGLVALLRSARVEGPVRAEHIAFGLAPRLNAVGRMGGAEDAVRLLLTRDPATAASLAERVERLNEERKSVQQELAERLAPPGAEAFDLVVDSEAHKGVLGIVAGQRMRESGRPTAVCTVQDGVAQCSLRAPEGYDLASLLELARPFLVSGGGHRSAAGMSFELARQRFVHETLVQGASRQAGSIPPILEKVDGIGAAEAPNPEERLRLEPFGQGFPDIRIAFEGDLAAPAQGFGNGHSKLRFQGLPGAVTWFFAGDQSAEWKPGDRLSLALSPQDHPKWGRSWRMDGLLEACQEPGAQP